MDIISISKLRILDSVTIEGLKKDMAAKGLKPYEAIRNALKEYYRNSIPSNTTTNLSPEVIEKIENSETLSRILVRKIFDLNESELRDLLNKAKSN